MAGLGDDGETVHRRGWQVSDDPDEPEVPEGFEWSWRHDDRHTAPMDWHDGMPSGNRPPETAESRVGQGENGFLADLPRSALDSVSTAAGEENMPVPFSNTEDGTNDYGAPQYSTGQEPAIGAMGMDDDLGHTAGGESLGAYDGYPQRSGVVPEQERREASLAPAPYEVSRETVPQVDVDTPIAREAKAAVEALARSVRPLPRPPRMRTFVVANQKGGVGKTTTTVNIAASLAQYGAKVLVVDLDPQGNASTALGIDHHSDVPSVYDVLIERYALDEVICPVEDVERLYCVPATIDLAGAEIELVSMVARESRLERALDGLKQDFDYVFIDCPPSLGLLTVNALVAGKEVMIPIQCEYYALEGLGQLLRNIELVRGHLNPELSVTTILLTMYDGRTRLAAQVAEEVRSHFPNEVLRTSVPRSVRISEAPSYSQTVMTYDPASSGALAYQEAAREIAERGAAMPGGEAESVSAPREALREMTR